MTVRDMIADLLQYNMDAEIMAWDNDCDEMSITGTLSNEDEDDIKRDTNVRILIDA